MLKDADVKDAFVEYTTTIFNKGMFYKASGEYKRQSGKSDMWKLFLERTLSLLARNGSLALVIPSGIVSNESAKDLRQIILLQNRVRYLYEFENTNGIFADVHRSYKFVLLVVDKTAPVGEFDAAFYLHDIDSLNDRAKERENYVRMSGELIKKVSPSSLSIPEVRGENEIEIFKKLYEKHTLLSHGVDNGQWNVAFIQEINRTSGSGLFRTDGKGWPLFEGKCFHQFIPDYEKHQFTIKPDEGLQWTSKIREYQQFNKQIHNICRLAFRDVAASTNVRAMIACIVPGHTFTPNTAPLVVPRYRGRLLLDKKYYTMILYLAGIFNSTVFDFMIRRRITMHLNFFYLEQTPIPQEIGNKLANEIMHLAARLSCCDDRFTDLADAVGVKVSALTINERIDLTAKLDACVAHHYGLNHEEYEYIVHTFDAFEEDKKIRTLGIGQVQWDDSLIRKFNGEMRKRALELFHELGNEFQGVN
jgi:hypothetical protein